MIRRFPFALTLVFVAAACGGSVSTAGTGGGGASSACPAAEPMAGAPCSDKGLSCTYGKCCPASATCDGSTWSVALPPCAAPFCPEKQPSEGDPCDECSTESDCSWWCDSIGDYSLWSCVEGSWTVTAQCEEGPVSCGDVYCASGEICLEKSGGTPMQPTCIENPCPPGTLDCSCGAAVCGGPPFECSVTDSTLSCVCPNCP